MESTEEPTLSVIVVIASDTVEYRASIGLLANCLRELARQVSPPPMEVIVPYHSGIVGIPELRELYPQVNFIAATKLNTRPDASGGREHHDELKSLALKAARGRVVGFLEDNEVPDVNWCAASMAAHRQEFAGIGGAIENRIDRLLNWAVYFCDFGRYQGPLPAEESASVSDANVSYKRASLEAVRHVWEDALNEVTLNASLRERGEKLALCPNIIVYQQREDLRLGRALRERYVWGRSFGVVRCKVIRGPKRLALVAASPLLPVLVATKVGLVAFKKRRRFGKYCQSLPLILLLQIAWGLGELAGYLTQRPA